MRNCNKTFVTQNVWGKGLLVTEFYDSPKWEFYDSPKINLKALFVLTLLLTLLPSNVVARCSCLIILC